MNGEVSRIKRLEIKRIIYYICKFITFTVASGRGPGGVRASWREAPPPVRSFLAMTALRDSK